MDTKELQKSRRREARKKAIIDFLEKVPHNLRRFSVVENLEHGSDFRFLSPEDKDKLTEYLEHPTPFLILSGGSGLGKSATAIGIAFELMRRDYAVTAKYISAAILLNEFSFGDGSEDRLRPFKRTVQPDILIIDDISLGSSLSTETRSSSMQALIAKRWEDKKYTIITTDLKIEEDLEDDGKDDTLRNWFGESSWNRIVGRNASNTKNMTYAVFSDDENDKKRSIRKGSPEQKKRGLSKFSTR